MPIMASVVWAKTVRRLAPSAIATAAGHAPDRHVRQDRDRGAAGAARHHGAARPRSGGTKCCAAISGAHSLAACSLSSRQPQKPRSGVLPSLPRQSIEAPRRSGRASGALLPAECREGFESSRSAPPLTKCGRAAFRHSLSPYCGACGILR